MANKGRADGKGKDKGKGREKEHQEPAEVLSDFEQMLKLKEELEDEGWRMPHGYHAASNQPVTPPDIVTEAVLNHTEDKMRQFLYGFDLYTWSRKRDRSRDSELDHPEAVSCDESLLRSLRSLVAEGSFSMAAKRLLSKGIPLVGAGMAQFIKICAVYTK